MSKQAVRLFLAVSTDIARFGLQTVLAKDPAIKIVGCTGSLEDVVPLVLDLRPDVIVLSLNLNASETLNLTQLIKENFTEAHFLLLGACGKERLAELLHAGVLGYCLLDTSIETLKLEKCCAF